MRRRTPCALIAALWFVSACDADDDGVAWLVLDAPPGSDIDIASARIQPEARVEQSIVDGARLFVAVRPGSPFRIEAKDACPLHIEAREATDGATLRHTLKPWITIHGATERAGFGGRVDVQVRAGCTEAERGHVEWTQLSGPELRGVTVSATGRRWTATLPDLEQVLGSATPWGIVPLSPRTRGGIELEAAWHGADGPRTVRKVRMAASPPVTGLPNVPLGSRLVLGGAGWTLVDRPQGSMAEVAGRHRTAGELSIDVAGDYRLHDARGDVLSLRAGRYDATPLDCERGGCHGDIARAALESPMSSALSRALESGTPRAACGLECHSVAGSGTADGGFLHVASEIGFDVTAIDHASWAGLPRDLRRQGGVGCLACHGPGAVPAPSARWAILRSDVCATCHDAPPRYGHVAAWRASSMARADGDVRARSEQACARCHTTYGFLQAQGVLTEPRPAPDAVGALGIGCAACHAVHDPAQALPRLVRRVRPVPLLGEHIEGTSLLCAACHAPERAGVISASAAAVWAGRGGLEPKSGDAIAAPAVHGALQCIDCHRSGPNELTRGAGHAFVADAAVCKRCHANPIDARAAQRALDVRARELWTRIARPAGLAALDAAGRPPHAAAPALDVTTPLGRAAFDVMLVLEDRGAASHGLPYARALLDAAERAVAAEGKRR